jgi:hypothetical protein
MAGTLVMIHSLTSHDSNERRRLASLDPLFPRPWVFLGLLQDLQWTAAFRGTIKEIVTGDLVELRIAE